MLRQKLFKPDERQEQVQQSGLLDLSLRNCPPDDISKYFPNMQELEPVELANSMLHLQRNFINYLNRENFVKSPIEYVYNPTEYAKIPNELYFKKYCETRKPVLFVGMNPGPFGMCQSGVPFGDTNWVRNWLHIEGYVEKPSVECPERPVEGFGCKRKEQSGDRWWRFWSEQCGTAEKFFQNGFVYNYCPLAFMDAKGRNLTPPEIKDSKRLEAICDEFYVAVIALMQPKIIIAIGKYIEKRTQNLLKKDNATIQMFYLPHPSPRAVKNHNWPEKALDFLQANNLTRYFNRE